LPAGVHDHVFDAVTRRLDCIAQACGSQSIGTHDVESSDFTVCRCLKDLLHLLISTQAYRFGTPGVGLGSPRRRS